MFSGAQSRPAAPHSEAVGYVHAAEAHSWWGVPHVAARTTTEEFARDSFENVLFGIARFFECVGSFPEELTVVSWTFKQGRFIAHAKALHWPMTSFVFAGVSNPQAAALTSALIAEERTLHSFNADPTGSAPGGELLEKRASRNPARRQHGYAISCPLLAPIFAWEGPAHLPVEACPWSEEKVN